MPSLITMLLGSHKDAVDSIPIDKTKLSAILLNEYRMLGKELDPLLYWISGSDKNLADKLIHLNIKLKHILGRQSNINLYRGFNKNYLFEINDLSGINVNALTVNSTISVDVTTPLSFSSNANIAKSFGKILLTSNTKDIHNYLVVTDELYVIACEFLNFSDYRTEKEVIVLPPDKFNVKILSK